VDTIPLQDGDGRRPSGHTQDRHRVSNYVSRSGQTDYPNLTEAQAIFHEMNLPAAGWMSAKVIVRQWWRGSGLSGYGPTWSCARRPWYSRRS